MPHRPDARAARTVTQPRPRWVPIPAVFRPAPEPFPAHSRRRWVRPRFRPSRYPPVARTSAVRPRSSRPEERRARLPRTGASPHRRCSHSSHCPTAAPFPARQARRSAHRPEPVPPGARSRSVRRLIRRPGVRQSPGKAMPMPASVCSIQRPVLAEPQPVLAEPQPVLAEPRAARRSPARTLQAATLRPDPVPSSEGSAQRAAKAPRPAFPLPKASHPV
ncbi:hypothetical protein SAMN04489716_0317 [Actinoplanes derwentensis]|uniref:Uncharacterized protein n=1 Tax=Actinoplanes derwentensis TaxID=113562 RepID=A0A1H1QIY0_9ACTN|nr:hypothetical protein SAMN04489716_0317 [Actinoplanes derwentensis]